MEPFAVAQAFFEACEKPLGWSGCKPYVHEGATFSAQSEPLIGITTIAAYADWLYGFGTGPAIGATYTLHASSFDAKHSTALFFATYHASHTGEGGPVPPTGRTTHSHYVYAVKVEGGKVAAMTKIWNSGFALRELGWG
jgi:hypothetical protein